MRPTLLAGLLAASAPPITPVIRASQTSGVAPLGVVFDGVTSVNADWRDCLFFFDAGDGSAGTYTYGSRVGSDKSKHVGMPVFAHAYETPGSYTATMWVYDGSRLWGPVTQSITVTDPEVVYAGANTICISTSGDFTGAPAGATQITQSNWTTVCSTHIASSKRVLLRAGEVWTCGTTQALAGGKADIYIGSFGSGAKPIVRGAANYVYLLQGLANGSNPANNPKRWRVNGLRFESGGFNQVQGVVSGIIAPAAGAIPLNPDASDGFFCINRCDFDGVYFPLYPNGRGHVIHACTTVNVNNAVVASGGASLYAQDVYQIAAVDCNLDNQGGAEHVVRCQGGKFFTLQGCTLKRPPAGKHFATFRGRNSYTSDYNGLSYCSVDGTGASAAVDIMLQFAPQNTSTGELIAKGWMDSCMVIANTLSQTAVAIEAVDIEVRSNVFRVPGTVSVTGGWNAVKTTNANTAGAPDPSGVRLIGNTLHYLPAYGASLMVNVAGSTGAKLYGNVAYAPSAIKNGNNSGTAPALYVDLDGSLTASGNSSDSQMKSTDPLWSSPGTTLASYALGSGSPYIDAGARIVGHWIDAQGLLRNSGGNYDMGAVNSSAKNTDAWTLTA